MSAKQPDARQPTHLGTWRALAAAPAMLASLLLLVFMLGGAGRWEAPVLLSWLTGGVLTLSAGGERIAVRVVCRFRRLSTVEHARIDPILIAVLEACGLDDVDLYVADERGTNAYAAGRRSIAVTQQVVDRHRYGELSDDVLAGLLSHEIGHLVTRSVRWSLIIAWFALPWRIAYRVGGRIVAPLAARQTRALLAAVVLTAFIVAISQAVRHGEWGSAVVLSALVVFILAIFATVGVGLARNHPVAVIGHQLAGANPAEAVGVILLLKAFAAGCSALTGVEAIANGVPAFRTPAVKRNTPRLGSARSSGRC